MPTTTTHFDLLKPLVNNATDQDLWGGYLNDDMDTIDAQLWTAQRFIKRDVIATGSVTTADNHKIILCDATSGAITLNLPAAATAGDGFTFAVKKTDASANSVTLDGSGSETIDLALTYPLSSANDGVLLVCNGANWKIIAATGGSVPDASTSVKGILQLATAAIFATGTDSLKALTADSFGQNITISGSELTIKFPKGNILKLGTITGVTAAPTPQVSPFAVAFPNTCTGVITSLNGASIGGDSGYSTVSATSAANFTTIYRANRTYLAWGT